MRPEDHSTTSPLERVATRLYQWAQRYGFLFLFLAFTALALSIMYASNLRVSQDFRKLLPQDSPSIEGLLRVDRAIGNQADLYIVIESPSRDENIRFGQLVHKEIAPWTDAFRFVTFHRDVSFFEDNALLFATIPELLEMHDRVQHRIKQEVENSMALDAGEDGAEQTESDEGLDYKAESPALPAPYMETNEGQLMVVIARPNFPNTDIDRARALYTRLSEKLAELQNRDENKAFAISLQGSFAEQSRRQSELDASIVKGSFLAFFILFASIGWYFRSGLVVFWILIPLTVAIAMALAAAMYLYGYLNIVSAFIVAILLGIGIDFGIHLMTRYRDERRGGLEPHKAVKIAMTQTGASTLAGALSTAASLFLLMFAEFQGLAQFGIVAGVGVLLAFVTAMLLVPKLLTRIGEGKRLASGHRVSPFPTAKSKKSIVALLPLAIGAIAILGSAYLSTSVSFEYDLEKLGSIRSKPKSSSNKKSWRAALPSGATTATMVVITEAEDETEFILEQLSTLRSQRQFNEEPPRPWSPPRDSAEDQGEVDDPFEDEDPFDDDDPFDDEDPFEDENPDPLASIRAVAYQSPAPSQRVSAAFAEYGESRVADMRDRLENARSIHSFVPTDQESKLAIIRATREAIARKRGALSRKSLDDLAEWEGYLAVDAPATLDQIPTWVRVQFLDTDGRADRFLVIKTRGAKADIANATKIRNAFATLTSQGGERPSAASFYVLPAVVEALHRDGPILLLLAFSVLLLTAWFLFKSFSASLLVAGTVATSLIWLLGIMGFMGWKIDLFNLIAIPLIVGMGQDHALHMLHRIREDGLDSIGRIIRETGGAIGLTTWTTSIGFVGVMMAPHAGLQSLARISLTGIILALFASVFFLPSVMIAYERYKNRSQAG